MVRVVFSSFGRCCAQWVFWLESLICAHSSFCFAAARNSRQLSSTVGQNFVSDVRAAPDKSQSALNVEEKEQKSRKKPHFWLCSSQSRHGQPDWQGLNKCDFLQTVIGFDASVDIDTYWFSSICLKFNSLGEMTIFTASQGPFQAFRPILRRICRVFGKPKKTCHIFETGAKVLAST